MPSWACLTIGNESLYPGNSLAKAPSRPQREWIKQSRFRCRPTPSQGWYFQYTPSDSGKSNCLNRILLAQCIIPESLLQIFLHQPHTHTHSQVQHIYFSEHPRRYISHCYLSSCEQTRFLTQILSLKTPWGYTTEKLKNNNNNKILPILILFL